jgi:hypothetical protein
MSPAAMRESLIIQLPKVSSRWISQHRQVPNRGRCWWCDLWWCVLLGGSSNVQESGRPGLLPEARRKVWLAKAERKISDEETMPTSVWNLHPTALITSKPYKYRHWSIWSKTRKIFFNTINFGFRSNAPLPKYLKIPTLLYHKAYTK